MIEPFIQAILANKTYQIYTLGGILVLLWIATVGIKRAIDRKKDKKTLKEASRYVLLQITQTPHGEKQISEMEEIKLFEDLMHSVVPEKKPITFEIAVANEGSDIMFFVATPEEYVETMKNQIRRVFQRAQVQEVPDYTIFNKNSSASMYNVEMKEFYGLPIRSYKKNETDTFAPIIGAFAGAKEESTGMALQIVLKRANKGKKEEIKRVVKELKKGKKLKHIKPTKTSDKLSGAMGTIEKTLDQKDTTKEEQKNDSEEAQIMEEKAQEQLYQANVRIGICAETKEKADLLFETVQGRFEQFGQAGHNSFTFNEKKDKAMTLNFTFRLPEEKTALVLSAEEATSIFHLPSQPIEVANLQWMKTKRVAAPTELSNEGLFLGDNIFHGKETEVYMPEGDRLRHVYIIGQTGTGKTATIKSMAYQDIQNGKGICIIDPHGDLVDDMLATVPEERLDDVIVFDPSKVEHPLGLNMLEYDRNRPEEKTFIVNEILSIFQRLFGQNNPESTGPAFQQYMRNTLLLLMEGKMDEPATLMDVPRVFTDDPFREELLKHCTLEPVRQFWEDEASKVEGDWSLANIAPYITSKFGNFTTNDYVRPIISQPYSSFSFREVMDTGKLLFVKLPKGKIGEINAQLLGMLTTGKIALAAFSRDDVPEHERKDFYFYIDEFQNFTTDSISQILSEARKYHLSLNIAHQYMAQLTDDIRGAVLGNVGSSIVFRVGVEDAEVLEKKFTPHFSAIELSETENLNCVVSMLSNNKPMNPFTMQVRFAPRGSDEVREKIVQYATLKHGKEKREHQVTRKVEVQKQPPRERREMPTRSDTQPRRKTRLRRKVPAQSDAQQ